MEARTQMKLVLAAGAVALLVVLAVLLLGTGESGGVPLPTAEDPGAPAASRQVDAGGASRRVDATARVPVSTSAFDEGAGPPTHAAVEGKVRDAAGTPLAGVRITARLLEEPRATRAPSRTTTDALGSFAFALPPDSLAELAFSYSGYRPSRGRVRRQRVVFDQADREGSLAVVCLRPHGLFPPLCRVR